MTIYTRLGDSGTTSLATGERVSKASARVEAYGAVDEANSAVALAAVAIDDPELTELLVWIQQRLFNCASALAGGSPRGSARAAIDETDIATLELAIDRFESGTGPLQHFILLGGSEAAARLNVARAIVRRAERRVLSLPDSEDVPPLLLAYLNRLSDTLFAAARHANRLIGHAPLAWDPDHSAPSRDGE
jgi:cob(I)alamin adenosyltransferase